MSLTSRDRIFVNFRSRSGAVGQEETVPLWLSLNFSARCLFLSGLVMLLVSTLSEIRDVKYSDMAVFPTLSAFPSGLVVMSLNRCWILSLCLFCAVAAGCGSKASSDAARKVADLESKSNAKAKKGIIPVRRDGKELLGNWVFVATIQGRDHYRWLLKFSPGEGGKTVTEFLDFRDDEGHDHKHAEGEDHKPEIVETEVSGDALRLVLKSHGSSFDFVGSFQAGIVRGTTKVGATELMLTRLLQTDETSLGTYEKSGLPPAADLFDSLARGKEVKPVELLTKLKDNQTSPVAQDMYAFLLGKHAEAKMDEAQVKELIDDYLASARIWGLRWEARSELVIATNLASGRRFPQLALEHLAAAEEKFGDEKDAFKDQIFAYRDAIHVQMSVRDIANPAASEEAKAAAEASLTELLKSQRYNAEILFGLADRAEKKGDIDKAIDYLSDVVTIPLLEIVLLQLHAGEPPNPPNEILKRLWTQKHGSLEGYDQHLAKVYEDRISELEGDLVEKNPVIPPAESTDRTVLVELFTGMRCLPCVPADLGLDAICKAYPRDKVVVMRLHQHIPEPDGLANQDSEERAAFYEVNSTPTLVVDGIKIDPRFYTGPLQATAGAYGVLRKVLDTRLTEKSGVSIKLTANVNNGQLDVSAEATGIPEDQLPSCRLRLAVVENHVHAFLPMATNGVREQDYVVREILGGAKGVAPKNGELKYSSSMPVNDLQEHVEKYVSQYELGRRIHFPPEIKPSIRGPLSIVAWVQNGVPDKKFGMRFVLQSVLAPITGDITFAPATTETTTNTKQEKPAEQPKAESPAAASTAADGDKTQTPAAPATPE